jgi:phenylacetate-CoA ligase
VQEAATSGSSGTPFTVARSRLDRLMAAAPVHRGRLWNQHDMALPLLAVARMDAARMDAGAPEPADGWSEVFPTGPGNTIDLRRPAKEILERICALSPAYVSIWPGLLGELLRLSARRGLRQVMTYGETAPPGLAALCAAAWGAPLSDTSSCEEVGPLAPICPEGRLHIQSEHAIVEVLDDADRPCAAGETGRVVVTNLHNFAMPTIRMKLGDLATVGPPCPCGRGLPVLARIEGRARDLPTLPDGLRVMPSFD